MSQLSQLLTPPLSWLPFVPVPAVCRYGAHWQMQMCACYISEATLVRSMRTISYHSCRGILSGMYFVCGMLFVSVTGFLPQKPLFVLATNMPHTTYLMRLTFLSWPLRVRPVVERSKSGQTVDDFCSCLPKWIENASDNRCSIIIGCMQTRSPI